MAFDDAPRSGELLVPELIFDLGRREQITIPLWIVVRPAIKPRMLVAIASANKMARTIWALLTKNEDYRGPVQVEAA